MTSFLELPLSAHVQEQVTAAQFSIPTPVQAAAIPVALQGKDILATAQTGTGKTLAYLIPIMEQMLRSKKPGIAALVLVPTRELAIQVAEQYETLRGKRLRPAALIVGGLPERHQLNAIRAGARLVVATPGRLEDFIGRRLLDFRGLTTLVLDEADRMLDMGFVPSIRRIIAVIPRQRQTMCFSATLEVSVAHLVNDCMHNPVRIALGSTLKPSNSVTLQAFEVSPQGKVEVLQQLLEREHGRCLVFARTKRGTERLARRLVREGISATMIHGDRSQSQRTAAMNGFQQGRFSVLVATDLAARGIHVDGIAHVINYDMPQIAEDFVHRVGRTGRAGDSGIASTLVTRSEMLDLCRLERSLNLHIKRMRFEDGQLSVQPDERPRVRTHAPEYAQPAPLASERRHFGHRPRTSNLRNAIC